MIVKMSGLDTALREIILKIDSTAKIPFGEHNCDQEIKVRVSFALDEVQELRVVGFKFYSAGKLGGEDMFDVNVQDYK